mmetsp:Transcript_18950/g.59523  ORF Transcript_18950/g.59523 Transcript_18950/m.59523 type:complete len:516 (+) Transcript_18950:280-1827(+)
MDWPMTSWCSERSVREGGVLGSPDGVPICGVETIDEAMLGLLPVPVLAGSTASSLLGWNSARCSLRTGTSTSSRVVALLQTSSFPPALFASPAVSAPAAAAAVLLRLPGAPADGPRSGMRAPLREIRRLMILAALRPLASSKAGLCCHAWPRASHAPRVASWPWLPRSRVPAWLVEPDGSSARVTSAARDSPCCSRQLGLDVHPGTACAAGTPRPPSTSLLKTDADEEDKPQALLPAEAVPECRSNGAPAGNLKASAHIVGPHGPGSGWRLAAALPLSSASPAPAAAADAAASAPFLRHGGGPFGKEDQSKRGRSGARSFPAGCSAAGGGSVGADLASAGSSTSFHSEAGGSASVGPASAGSSSGRPGAGCAIPKSSAGPGGSPGLTAPCRSFTVVRCSVFTLDCLVHRTASSSLLSWVFGGAAAKSFWYWSLIILKAFSPISMFSAFSVAREEALRLAALAGWRLGMPNSLGSSFCCSGVFWLPSRAASASRGPGIVEPLLAAPPSGWGCGDPS